MRVRGAIAALVGIMLITLGWAATPPAHAQAGWPCDEIVVDWDGLLGDGIDDVRRAAEEVGDRGAQVRVFAIWTTAGDGLESYVSSIERQCPSWRSADDQATRENLIVVGISVSEQSTLLRYGERWFPLLDGHQSRIQTEVMNPRFASGDYAGGLAAGLQEIGRVLGAKTRSGVALGILAGVALLGGAGAAVGVMVHRRAARKSARQRAREAKVKVASRILELQEQLPFLEVDIQNAEEEIPDQSAQALRGQLGKVQQAIAQTSVDYQSVEIAGADPEREDLSTEEYAGFERSYQELLQRLEDAHAGGEAIRSRIQELVQAMAQARQGLQDVERAIQEAQETVTGLESKNKRAESLLEQARTQLEQAGSAASQRDADQASERIVQARTLTEQAVTAAGQLAALTRRIEEVERTIDAGAETFDEIARRYAEASWESIRGNGTEAENRVEWARDSLQLAEEGFASSKEGDWATALERLTRISSWLDEAAGLIESIQEHKGGLERAQHDAPEEVQAATSEIQAAWEYIQQVDPDVREQLEEELAAAEAELQQTRAELAHEKPNFPQALALAQQAGEAADRILAEARSEHEAIERLRQKYSTTIRAAEASASRASYYIRNHRSDVGTEAHSLLEQAESTLTQARGKREEANQVEDLARRRALEEAVPLVREAQEQADRAYSQAEQTFRQAERARQAERTWPSALPNLPIPTAFPSAPWGTPRPSPLSPSSRPGSPGAEPTPQAGRDSTPSQPRRSSSKGQGSRPPSPSGGSSSGWGSGPAVRSSGGSTQWGRSASRRRHGGGTTGW